MKILKFSKLKSNKYNVTLEDGEIFGYYCNTEIVEKHNARNETDNKSFHFNLQSNGRLEKPMKYEIIDIDRGCTLFGNSDDELIRLGNIDLVKENYKDYICPCKDYRDNIEKGEPCRCGLFIKE